MSRTEVICRFSQSGFYTQKSVFNNIAFQQWCQHHLTVPFLSFRKHPSCVCQEFDTGRAWVRKTYGCSIIWNMGDAWELRSSCFHCYCGDTVLGVRSPTWLPCWSNMVWFPVAFWYLALFYYSSDSSFWRRSSHYWAFSSLCEFGLVDFSIKIYFIFRCARYAILIWLLKSDVWIVLKIFLSYKLLEINSISLFFVFKPWVLFFLGL